jgi:signal transduction histidine kinase
LSWGIGHRLLISYLVLIALAMGLLCTYLLFAFRQFHLEWAEHDLRARAEAISNTIVELMKRPDRQHHLEGVTTQFQQQDRVIVRVLDEHGMVLGSTDPGDRPGDNRSSLPGVRLGLAGQDATGQAYRGTPSMERLYVVVPVKQDDRILGVVRMSLLLRDLQSAYRRMRNVAIGALLITFTACSVLSLLLARGLVRPVSHMSTMAARIGAGKLGERIQVRGPRELAQLGFALNAMADRLAEQERVRREFLANASHEFRTPLSNVRVALETVLETRPRRPEMVQRMLTGAVGEIERLTLLVNDLLDLARIQSEPMPLERCETPIRALIQPLVAAVAPRLEAQRLRLQLDVPAELRVQVDPQRMQQALMNLLDNAIRCTPEGGHIRIAADETAVGVEIRVRDDGPGIPEEDLPYIFDRFYTVDKARSRSSSGTGLGLAITRSIVEAHGGSVRVTSGLAGGCIFTLCLPR